MIRAAELKDADEIFPLALEFAKVSQKYHGFSINETKIKWCIKAVIGDKKAIGLVSIADGKVDGFIYGQLTEPYFSNDIVAQEFALYSIRPLHIMRLIDAFEVEAKAKGATKICVGCKPKFFDLSNIYERKGYSLLEDQYIKGV